MRTAFIGLLLSFTFMPGAALAQPQFGPVGFHANAYLGGDGGDEILQRTVLRVFRDRAAAHPAFFATEPAPLHFRLQARDFEQDGVPMVVVSIMALTSLPEPIIAHAREHEIFYAGVSDETRAQFDEEGQWVRQHMSEDFMRGYLHPSEHEILIVPKEELATAFDGWLSGFVERRQEALRD